jgi:predicted PurR-regulated permease PerM
VLFLWLTLNVDLIIFAGVLRRAADRMSGFTRIPVGVALPLVVLLVLAFLAGIGWFFAQAIASQIDQLTQQLPAAAAKVGTIVRQSSLGKIFMKHISSTSIMESPTTMLQKFFGVASIAVEVAGAIAVMLFLGLYFAADANLYMSGLL